MATNCYSDKRGNEYAMGESVLLPPRSVLFIPANGGNIRATIESEDSAPRAVMQRFYNSRDPCPIFWHENLVSLFGGRYVFQTRYCTEEDDILPPYMAGQIPVELRRAFLRPVPPAVRSLTSQLTDMKDTRRTLTTFCNFVDEHEITDLDTGFKPIPALMDEYARTGRFSGNCKETTEFFMALCDAIGLPSKKVYGRKHRWADVLVPVGNGYKLFPVDSALGKSGNHNPEKQIFDVCAPSMMSTNLNIVPENGNEHAIRLKIEQIH